ncbi:hypothetical protein K474DRAFT_1713537 [Panus rudis PR-1116 ss-1]|nr:hypothetical protein K474DRAFT_1713537 [Panus rudis PR-1116 ss-1]
MSQMSREQMQEMLSLLSSQLNGAPGSSSSLPPSQPAPPQPQPHHSSSAQGLNTNFGAVAALQAPHNTIMTQAAMGSSQGGSQTYTPQSTNPSIAPAQLVAAPAVPTFTFAPAPHLPSYPLSSGHPAVPLSSGHPAVPPSSGHPSIPLSAGHPPVPSSRYPSAPSFGIASATQPFLAFNQTQNPASATRTNNARMASASSTGASRSGSSGRSGGSGRTSRPRSTSYGVQSNRSPLPSNVNKEYERCLTPEGKLRIRTRIYPPVLGDDSCDGGQKSESIRVLDYRERRTSVEAYLQERGLLIDEDLPISTRIVDMCFMFAERLEQSPLAYRFNPGRTQTQYRHEHMPFSLLGFFDHGRSKKKLHAYLQKIPLPSPEMTLGDMISKMFKDEFSPPKYAIKEGRFVLNLLIRRSGLMFRHSDSPPHLPPVVHTCLSYQFYEVEFSYDDESLMPPPAERVEGEPDPSICNGCLSHAQAPTRPSTPTLDDNIGSLTLEDGPSSSINDTNSTAPHGVRRRRDTTSPELQPRTLQVNEADSSRRNVRSPPPGIIPYRPLPLRWGLNPLLPSNRLYSHLAASTLEEFTASVQSGASLGTTPVPELSIEATDIAHLAIVMRDIIVQCLEEGDFTPILGCSRTFRIAAATDNVGSLGVGIETELWHKLRQGVEVDMERYFTTRLDHLYILDTPELIRNISPAQKTDLQVMGAVIALCITHGIPLPKIDGAWLIYLIYECNFNALTYDVVREYHPELAKTIKELVDIGHTGDLSPYSPYFEALADTRIEHFGDRDVEEHSTLVSLLLHRAVVGKFGRWHPYVQAFRDGFDLPCRNGFRFWQAARTFNGGPQALIRLCASLQVKDYTSIKDFLEVSVLDSVESVEAREGRLRLRGFDGDL